MKMIQILIWFFAAFGLSFTVKAQILRNITPAAAVDDAIVRLATDSVLLHGQLGVAVMDVETGALIAARAAQTSLVPASNLKILTTGAALGVLGENYTYRTELAYDGTLQTDGTLDGNLYIKGYGDPTLGSPDMDSVLRLPQVLDTFCSAIRQAGIKKINGAVVGDGTIFEAATAVRTWLIEDVGNAYGAGPSGLNLNDNSFLLTFGAGLPAGSTPPVMQTAPEAPGLQFVNTVRSAAINDDESYILSVPYSPRAYLLGKIPARLTAFTVGGSLPDPPFFAAWQIRRRLIDSFNITVRDSATTMWKKMDHGDPLPPPKTIFSFRSPPLKSIVRMTNLESVNLYAETMLRTLAFEQTGEGTNDGGVQAVLHFWKQKGLDTVGLFMKDGSGLSPNNGVAPYQLVDALRLIARDSAVFPAFYASLPQAGVSGTLKNMFKGTAAIGRLCAKSGTISRVKCYSGYVTGKSGKLYAFSVMANNFTGTSSVMRKKLEVFMVELCRL